jgi:hypothetical protein
MRMMIPPNDDAAAPRGGGFRLATSRRNPPPDSLATLVALASCAWFILTAQPFMTRIGIQNDEAWFAAPIYLPGSALYYFRIGPLRAAMMRASYIGTLKTLLWTPVFGLFGPNAWSVREPAVLLGALTIWLFFLLLRRVAGERAAAVGAVLLAADSMFLLTTCYDFGLEVVGHIPLIGALLLLVYFFHNGSERYLAGASLLAGLALWDKALALWLLGAMGVAALAFYPRQMLKLIAPRRVALVLFWIALGALPLVLYNIHSRLGTLRQNALPDNVPFSTKVWVLRGSFNGSIMSEFLNASPFATPAPRTPSTAFERLSASLAAATGHPIRYWIIYAFMMALFLAPMAGPGDRRIIWFCLLTMAITWAQMVWTTRSGTSVHHTILMWPLTASHHGNFLRCGLAPPEEQGSSGAGGVADCPDGGLHAGEQRVLHGHGAQRRSRAVDHRHQSAGRLSQDAARLGDLHHGLGFPLQPRVAGSRYVAAGAGHPRRQARYPGDALASRRAVRGAYSGDNVLP